MVGRSAKGGHLQQIRRLDMSIDGGGGRQIGFHSQSLTLPRVRNDEETGSFHMGRSEKKVVG